MSHSFVIVPKIEFDHICNLLDKRPDVESDEEIFKEIRKIVKSGKKTDASPVPDNKRVHAILWDDSLVLSLEDQ